LVSAPALRLRSNGVDIDYRVIFDAVPGLYMLLDPLLNIVGVNDAYAKATLIDKAAVVDRPLFEIFPDNPDDPNADGVTNLRASLLRVLKTGKADVMAVQKYDVRQADGSFVEKHWAPMNTPVLDDDGCVSSKQLGQLRA
jgi:PAS domain-containing protein